MGLGQLSLDPRFGATREVERGVQAEFLQVGRGLRTDAPFLLQRQVLEVEVDLVRLDGGEAGRFSSLSFHFTAVTL